MDSRRAAGSDARGKMSFRVAVLAREGRGGGEEVAIGWLAKGSGRESFLVRAGFGFWSKELRALLAGGGGGLRWGTKADFD